MRLHKTDNSLKMCVICASRVKINQFSYLVTFAVNCSLVSIEDLGIVKCIHQFACSDDSEKIGSSFILATRSRIL